MPDRNSRPAVILGSRACSSLQAEEMDMATSMTAPREAMRMPLIKRPRISSGCSPARSTKSSASPILNPLMGVILPTIQAKRPAAATPQIQPRPAHRVFRVNPVSSSSEAAAVSAATATAAGMGGAPRSTMGISRNQTPAKV